MHGRHGLLPTADTNPAARARRRPQHSVGLPGSPGWLSRVAAHGPQDRAAIVHGLQRGAGNRALLRAGMGDVHLAEFNAERRTLRTLDHGVGAPVAMEAAPAFQAPADATGPLGAAYAAIAQARQAAKDADAAFRKADAEGQEAANAAEDASIAALPEPAKGKKKPKAKHAKVDTTHQQELGSSRDSLVQALRAAHAAVDGLSAQTTGLAPAEFDKARAAMRRELARLAPYYYQRANADILGNGSAKAHTPAGERTCNVTSLSMTLESLGITASDFHGPELPMLAVLKAHFHDPLGQAFDVVSDDLAGYRLPELLQLLAVAKALTARNAEKKNASDQVTIETATADPQKFADVVEEARKTAASMVTHSSWFDTLVSDFDVHVANEFPFEGKQAGGVGWDEIIDRYGDVQKAVKGARRDKLKALNAAEKKAKTKITHGELTADELAEVDAATLASTETGPIAKLTADIAAAPGQIDALKTKQEAAKTKTEKAKLGGQIHKLESEVKGWSATLEKESKLRDLGVNQIAIAGDGDKLEAIIPIEQYAAIVSAALTKHLDAGHEIVGHMVGHFFRVEDVKADGVVCDDPYFGKNKLRKWAELRSIAGFTRFSVVTRR